MSRRSPSRHQIVLIPELVKNRVENKPHAARFFWYIANSLYLPFYETNYQGAPAFDRPTLVALILYGLFEGHFTPDSIRELAKYNLGAIWILGKMSLPSSKTISRVMDDILDNIELLFEQVFQLCQAFELVGQERMYIDGTKTKANASKHKAMSYKYMSQKIAKGEDQISDLVVEVFSFLDNYNHLNDEDLKQLIISESEQIYQEAKTRHQAKLKAEKKALFSGKQLVKQPVNNNFKDNSTVLNMVTDKDIPQTKETMDSIGFKVSRIEKIKTAKRLLEKTWIKENGHKPIPDKTQINFTDPESSIMVTKHHGVQQCYNNFALVDDKAHIIVGAYTANSPGDKQAFIPTVEHANKISVLPDGIVIGADAGFFSATNIEYSLKNRIDFYASFPEAESPFAKDKFIYDKENNCYICPEGEKLKPGKRARKSARITTYKTKSCLNCPAQSKCTRARDGIRKIIRYNKGDKLREEAKEKALTPAGREILRMRKAAPEPVWGNLKQQDDLVQLHYRGLDKAGREFKLRCVMHNLRKLYKVFKNNSIARNKIINMGCSPPANVA